MIQRVKISIRGTVQGVGFRPFIYRIANELNLKGWIVNNSQGVFIDAEGNKSDLISFINKIKTDKPKNSYIQSFEFSWLDPYGYKDFEIRKSDVEGSKTALVLPDLSTCKDCLSEIFDPNNRRYLYPFTNCTNCGPRYTIIISLPYDRKNTIMNEFEMCDDCLKEYTDPLNRRFHAEPIACSKCGPKMQLALPNKDMLFENYEAIKIAAKFINEGKIIALKGIGGFQLLCDARNSDTIKLLRLRKKRNQKPFALMFPDINSVTDSCEVNETEFNLLNSVESPIVLLKKKKNKCINISEECAVGNPYLGIMLPYSPLHHLLMKELNYPVIATSGNISEEPICINEEQAFEKLQSIADYFLIHNRKILRYVDDSICRVVNNYQMIIRRARGFAPLPIHLKNINKTVLAVGAHLKNTVAVNNLSNVFVSQHIGDLENNESINAFKNTINDLNTFYELKPDIIVCDLHPDYISTKYAENLPAKNIKLQHHYAHVLSCIAENELEDNNILGISWDGTGYGIDGNIWGGEFLIPNGKSFKRAAFLKPFKLPGGESAIHNIWKIGFSLLYETFGNNLFISDLLNLQKNIEFLNFADIKILKQMVDKNINTPLTSSAGRLFDGVASILGIRNTINYEAQGAIELEFCADDFKTNDYFTCSIFKSDESYIIDWSDLIKKIVVDLENNIPVGLISAKFHNSLVYIMLKIAEFINFEKIILTGGCFQNKYLLENAINVLSNAGFKVYINQRVPPGDGGISLGQIKYAEYF